MNKSFITISENSLTKFDQLCVAALDEGYTPVGGHSTVCNNGVISHYQSFIKSTD